MSSGHRKIYLIVGGVLAVLLVVMLVTYSYNRSNEEAVAKAEQLITAFDEAGLRAPKDPARGRQMSSVPTAELSAARSADGVGRGIAKLNLSVGGAFYTRPVIADRRVGDGTAADRPDLLPGQGS